MKIQSLLPLLAAAWWAAGASLAQQPTPTVELSASTPIFANVNGKQISVEEFANAYSTYLRETFYHRKPPQDGLEAALKTVADQLIENVLLREEVARRKIEPDAEAVEKQIVAYENRYATSPMWQQNRATLLPGLRERIADKSRLEMLEKAVRALPVPTEEEVKQFYASRPELFTEPEKLRLHTILLHIEPSSPGSAWESAREEAAGIAKRLRRGADFAEAARMHSRDVSAPNGGDMGYLHRGMIPEALQGRIDDMKPGDISDPIDVLEGVAIFRFDERVAAKLRAFPDVAARAGALLLRERQDKAWQAYRDHLRAAAKVEIIQMPKVIP